ncbi:hypothetical protein BDV96DRAFT_598001 [Lophiotrema nucula]|uniref:Uncharacterized protein n=1 Tax=Lophiotrema nucula TaxID=690887 RepID=A0A6A5ZCX0_9PLEO|nr:hypothetical protein BDV96DRAFT_598001 [Lophiotrema nucula]
MTTHEPLAVSAENERLYDKTALEKRAARAAKRKTCTKSSPSPPPLPAWLRHYSLFEVPFFVGDAKLRKWKPLNRYRPDEWYTEIELFLNELWKARVVETIDTRIDSFSSPIRCKSPRVGSNHTTASESATARALNVMELLEAILIAAGPQAQLDAYNVCHRWRDAAIYTIRSQVKFARLCEEYPSSAIGYDAQEMIAFEDALVLAHQDVRNPAAPDYPLYFPARLTQSCDLSQEMWETFHEFDDLQRQAIADGGSCQARRCRNAGIFPTEEIEDNIWAAPDQSPPHEPSWLDFSQFNVNPYLPGIFSGGMRERLGSLEITLSPTASGHPLLKEQSILSPLLEPLLSTYITQPPCRTIGLFTWEPLLEMYGHSQLSFLTHLHDKDGIRTITLLNALDQVTNLVIERWVGYAKQLRQWISGGHWKYDVWTVPGAPKIVILLSNDEILSRNYEIPPNAREDEDPAYTHQSQWIQTVNREPRLERQREWMSDDTMKPPRPQVQEVAVFPGLYHIAQNPDLFEASSWFEPEVRPLHRKLLERIRRRSEELDWMYPYSWLQMRNAFGGLDLEPVERREEDEIPKQE